MAWETRVQSQVDSYQRHKKMVLDASLLNPQHNKVLIKDKWSNPGNGVAPFPTSQCWGGCYFLTAIEKEAFRLPSTMVSQLNLFMDNIVWMTHKVDTMLN